jgi:hypothetical protein
MNKYLKLGIGAIIGAGLGYAYYYVIGCSSGKCPITSNWHFTALYGAAMGLVMAYPTKKKVRNNNMEEPTDKKENFD